MPEQKPGRSKQDYGTPKDLLKAVRRRLGIVDFAIDLAAHEQNHVVERYFGSGGALPDSFPADWSLNLGPFGWGWLNPPFDKIAPWAQKCEREARRGAHVAFLVPASVGSNWWRDYVDRRSMVLFLNGRPSFDGIAPYPKDIAVCLFGATFSGYECWPWRGILE